MSNTITPTVFCRTILDDRKNPSKQTSNQVPLDELDVELMPTRAIELSDIRTRLTECSFGN